MTPKEYNEKHSLEYNLESYDEGGYLGIDEELLHSSLEDYAKIQVIDFAHWLVKQNLIISEGTDGYTFRSSMFGGKKYSAEELYEHYIANTNVK